MADYFGKKHGDIIRTIDLLLSEEGAEAIECNFASIEVEVKVGFGTRLDRAYEMTRDGFTELVMGFTGAGEKAQKHANARSYYLRIFGPWVVA